MEKLTEIIPAFRIGEDVKKTLIKMAELKKRKLSEFIRIQLECTVEDFNQGKDRQCG